MERHRKRASRSGRIEPGSRWEWEHLIPDDNGTESATSKSDDDDDDDTPTPGSAQLGELFHGLPREVRNEIFAQLLVRPVKWDVKHQAECEKRRKVPPHESIRPRFERSVRSRYTCASRMQPNTDLDTQLSRLPIWRDPWLSRWAPEQTNKWVCTLCWTARLRPRPIPRPGPCRARARVSGSCKSCCLRVLPANDEVPLDPGYELSVTEVDVEGDRGLGRAWTLLAELPALSDLELDAIFLTSAQAVRVLRQPGPRGLRRVHFTQNRPLAWQCRADHRARSDWKYGVLIPRPVHGNIHLREVQSYVWPSQHRRKSIHDSEFATDIARSIKGLRHERDKDYSVDDATEALQEKERYVCRFSSDVAEVVPCEEDVQTGIDRGHVAMI
ncbi:hypothetical protein PG994_014468 [Apiospora phragmitis]|uniref:Uncharacterized protein n=1 Tax=Apiospora phragmitis TaxID=2905665 RepID=A0ABR1T4E2_9PEZI